MRTPRTWTPAGWAAVAVIAALLWLASDAQAADRLGVDEAKRALAGAHPGPGETLKQPARCVRLGARKVSCRVRLEADVDVEDLDTGERGHMTVWGYERWQVRRGLDRLELWDPDLERWRPAR